MAQEIYEDPVIMFAASLNTTTGTGSFACFMCPDGTTDAKQDGIPSRGVGKVVEAVGTHIVPTHGKGDYSGTFTVNDETDFASLWEDERRGWIMGFASPVPSA